MGARRAVVAALLGLLVVGCAGADADTGDGAEAAAGDATAQLVAEGERLYDATCAVCHGEDMRGTDLGPPLLDPVYAPDHHPDVAFHAAVELGVQAHHWEFGPMPPQNVSEDGVDAIIAYVRSVQRTEGIE